jgi:hypothetical protein
VIPIKMPITIAIMDGVNITCSINSFISSLLKKFVDFGVKSIAAVPS